MTDTVQLLGRYANGNTVVSLFSDGTKIREFPDNEKPTSEFPECIDMTVSYRCNMGCEFCYQNATKDGLEANLSEYDSLLDSIHPWTEVALNGNEITDQFVEFLRKLKARNIIANVTFNQAYFMKHEKTIRALYNQNLIMGIGISLQKPTSTFIDLIKKYDRAVVHLIAGIVSRQDLYLLSNHNLSVLFLGYKQIGRGKQYILQDSSVYNRLTWLKVHLCHMINGFKYVSFDNLALDQLNVKSLVKEKWNELYMGDDGEHTFYVDLVHKKAYKSSLESESCGIDLTNNITDDFAAVKSLYSRS